MTKVRDIVDDQSLVKDSMWSWFRKQSSLLFTNGFGVFQFGYAYGKYLGWFVVTTGLITALPLIFEVKREGQLEDLERAQIAAGLQEGRTPQELAMSGLQSAIEPAVLK